MMHMNSKKQQRGLGLDEKDSRLIIDDDDDDDSNAMMDGDHQAIENSTTVDNLCDKCGSPKNKK